MDTISTTATTRGIFTPLGEMVTEAPYMAISKICLSKIAENKTRKIWIPSLPWLPRQRVESDFHVWQSDCFHAYARGRYGFSNSSSAILLRQILEFAI